MITMRIGRRGIEAALSVSGPAHDYSTAYIRRPAGELQDAAADLRRRLYGLSPAA
ncbi:hypothetical protein [Govanella unica]|uniref:Uncharacterized protein n=1 Tax=Govanella unica TaxID=2975056 RepID=A0A9X3TWQ0_9PROT|nr:hypothetical protein [Govania unica]MDA5193028.1 hypothetical protein [Govania unica]